MDGDTIGASVEINTTSAFDRKKDYYAVSAEGSWNDYSGKTTPKGSFDFFQAAGRRFRRGRRHQLLQAQVRDR
ncbi:hypothetical protein ACFSTD_20365 [Novosphingobium colocasiae]